MNNTFNKPTDGGAGRQTADRESRPTSMVCISSRKKRNAAPSMMERVQCNPLTTRWLAGPPGECCHIASSALVFAVDMLTYWALHRSIQISLGEGTILLSSWIASTPDHTATCTGVIMEESYKPLPKMSSCPCAHWQASLKVMPFDEQSNEQLSLAPHLLQTIHPYTELSLTLDPITFITIPTRILPLSSVKLCL